MGKQEQQSAVIQTRTDFLVVPDPEICQSFAIGLVEILAARDLTTQLARELISPRTERDRETVLVRAWNFLTCEHCRMTVARIIFGQLEMEKFLAMTGASGWMTLFTHDYSTPHCENIGGF